MSETLKIVAAEADGQNLRALWQQRATASPNRDFLFSSADNRRYTYAEFSAIIQRTAQMLAAHGVSKGDVVSLLLPNSIEYIAAYFACWHLGAIAGPVNGLLKESEIAYIVGHSEAKAALVHSTLAARLLAVREHLPQLQHIITFDDVAAGSRQSESGQWSVVGGQTEGGQQAAGSRQQAVPEFMPADDVTAVAESTENIVGAETKPENVVGAESWPEIGRDDEALIIYTSGTTGAPKGCLLTHGNMLTNAREIVDWLGFSDSERLYTMMPLFHVNAIMVGTVAPLYAGGSVVVAPKFSASKFWQDVARYGVTTFGSVATMLALLNQTYPEGVPPELDISRLRFALCGSAPVPREVMETFEQRFKCLVIEGYGLSESTCRATFNPPDARRRPSSCGLPIGNELRIVDDNDAELSAGELGEIVLRGANLLKGYFKDPAATARAWRGGWFHTGDIGYRDADGFCYIVDRKSDMIIRAGENIYPREIDEVLYTHPAIAAAAVVGVPDALYGEEVAAFVVLAEGQTATETEIIAYCRARLADYKCPKTVRFVADIPKGPTGKLLKRALV